jgi:hypothetical protein
VPAPMMITSYSFATRSLFAGGRQTGPPTLSSE